MSNETAPIADPAPAAVAPAARPAPAAAPAAAARLSRAPFNRPQRRDGFGGGGMRGPRRDNRRDQPQNTGDGPR